RWDSSVGGRTPQRSSGGEMVATLDSREYGGLHQIPCPEYMLVVEPQYPVVSDTQARIPDTVRHRIVVRTAVDFDHQPLPDQKVNAVLPYPHLLLHWKAVLQHPEFEG